MKGLITVLRSPVFTHPYHDMGKPTLTLQPSDVIENPPAGMVQVPLYEGQPEDLIKLLLD